MLKSGGNVLLLDEPTNDLDVETLRALEEALEDFAGCAVVISHDRWFLDRLATHILAFEGDSHVEWFEGNFAGYEEDKKRRLGAGRHHPAPDQVQEVRALKGARPAARHGWPVTPSPARRVPRRSESAPKSCGRISARRRLGIPRHACGAERPHAGDSRAGKGHVQSRRASGLCRLDQPNSPTRNG